ncbi:26083_t:CDS:2, partial [Gigaspora rosea]
MPCYADTIVRIKYVRRTERQDIKSLVVWALGAYPVECDDCEIEMVLFLPFESQERDLETQAIFERDSFYSVGVSTGVVILNKAVNSNKYSLKISLIGIPQELPRIVGTDGNAVVNVLVNDYAGWEYNFTVKVVFPHLNSRFAYLMNAIRPEDSLVFVVGQME